MLNREWMRGKLKRLAVALGEEFITDERLEIYAENLSSAMGEEEFELVMERAENEMTHFPQLVDLFWFLEDWRFVTRGPEEERGMREAIREAHRASGVMKEVPPSMRKEKQR